MPHQVDDCSNDSQNLTVTYIQMLFHDDNLICEAGGVDEAIVNHVTPAPFPYSLVCLLIAQYPSNKLVYLRDTSAQTILRAATLREKLQIQLSTSHSHSILTPGQPVLALTP